MPSESFMLSSAFKCTEKILSSLKHVCAANLIFLKVISIQKSRRKNFKGPLLSYLCINYMKILLADMNWFMVVLQLCFLVH